MLQRLSRPAFVVGILLVTVLSLLPGDVAPETQTWDKANHAAAYAALAFAGVTGFPGRRSLLLVGLGLLLLGGVLELIQASLPGRSASSYDVFANLVGILFGSLVATGVAAVQLKADRARDESNNKS